MFQCKLYSYTEQRILCYYKPRHYINIIQCTPEPKVFCIN